MSLGLFLYLAIITSASRAEPLFGKTLGTRPETFPFVVSICRRSGILEDYHPQNPLNHVCGGALIAPTWVLTAASCFETNEIDVNHFVLAGSNNLANSAIFVIENVITFKDRLAPRPGPSQTKECKTVPPYAEDDVALAELRIESTYPGPHVRLWIIRPEDLADELKERNWNLVTAGWKKPRTNDEQLHRLLGAELQLVDRNECLQPMEIFCTRGLRPYITILDDCDKGSPIMAKHHDGDYRVVGINLRPVAVNNEATLRPELQNLHISVDSYVEFIRSVTGLPYLQNL